MVDCIVIWWMALFALSHPAAQGFVLSSSNVNVKPFGVPCTPSRGSGDALSYSNSQNITESVIINSSSSSSGSSSHAHFTQYVKVAPNGAQITLIGSGPGSPDLLTVAAHRILTGTSNNNTNTDNNNNNLIIADRLVSTDVLDICVGEVRVAKKYRGCAEQAQEEIYEWAEEGVRQGRHVIRLKIGDPFVFGRGGEEVLRFRSTCGIEPTVIPGVSAALSAPLLGGIPVTHRGSANQVVICTGYGKNGTEPDLIKYHKDQTVVFLMAVGRLHQLMDSLCTMAGFPRDTPVGIVERAGCANQRTLVGDMATISELAELHDIQAPSTIIVGHVVRVLLSTIAEEGEEINIENGGAVFHGLLPNNIAEYS